MLFPWGSLPGGPRRFLLASCSLTTPFAASRGEEPDNHTGFLGDPLKWAKVVLRRRPPSPWQPVHTSGWAFQGLPRLRGLGAASYWEGGPWSPATQPLGVSSALSDPTPWPPAPQFPPPSYTTEAAIQHLWPVALTPSSLGVLQGWGPSCSLAMGPAWGRQVVGAVAFSLGADSRASFPWVCRGWCCLPYPTPQDCELYPALGATLEGGQGLLLRTETLSLGLGSFFGSLPRGGPLEGCLGVIAWGVPMSSSAGG